jgi:hypothetical protein
MRSLIILCAISGVAAADSFETRETFGLDVTTIWEPRNGDAFGAGPMLRAEFNSTKMPSWLDIVIRWGVLLDSADRTFAPFTFGFAAKLGAPYLGLEIGGTIYPQEMDDSVRLGWTAGGVAGLRLGHWDLRATAMRGELFDGNVWLFSIGRDFARMDASVKRSFF